MRRSLEEQGARHGKILQKGLLGWGLWNSAHHSCDHTLAPLCTSFPCPALHSHPTIPSCPIMSCFLWLPCLHRCCFLCLKWPHKLYSCAIPWNLNTLWSIKVYLHGPGTIKIKKIEMICVPLISEKWFSELFSTSIWKDQMYTEE